MVLNGRSILKLIPIIKVHRQTTSRKRAREEKQNKSLLREFSSSPRIAWILEWWVDLLFKPLRWLLQGVPASFGLNQKSWILKTFYASSSAGNPGSHWVIGLKIKSYYQTIPFWWKLNQEKAVLCSKKWKFISKPDQFYVSRSAGKPWYNWTIGLKIKSYYQTIPFWWKLNQEKAVLCSKNWKLI